jgi:hypothetical protein
VCIQFAPFGKLGDVYIPRVRPTKLRRVIMPSEGERHRVPAQNACAVEYARLIASDLCGQWVAGL